MKTEAKWSATEYPEDIVDAIMYDLELPEKWHDDLVNAVYYVKACAENEKNDDSFRALYNMLEAMYEKIYEDMPWWDKE